MDALERKQNQTNSHYKQHSNTCSAQTKLCKEYEHHECTAPLLEGIRYALGAHGTIKGLEYAPRQPAFFLAQLLMNEVPVDLIPSMCQGLKGPNPLSLRYIAGAPLCFIGVYRGQKELEEKYAKCRKLMTNFKGSPD